MNHNGQHRGAGERALLLVSAAAAMSERVRAKAAEHEVELPTCEECRIRPAVKTDGEARQVCEPCHLGATPPIRRAGPLVRRNGRCPCGSGRKFKGCCLGKAACAGGAAGV